ncbi:double zinc ribbon domain-containing protein [Rhodovulum sp. YNF3179]|uniref:double zinc ribbon domain-containing protein n=1 Tax=Rhodovulum sp. YNF3179 TaxID=3425127 RepID=UPI003D3429B8
MRLQSALRLLYPPQCLGCAAPVETEFGLCGTCWRDMAFLSGAGCDMCGQPLAAAAGPDEDPASLHCDDCLAAPRPWARGRAALRYEGTARRLVLGLKHGDRTDLARPAGAWMARAAAPLLSPDTLIVPVPLHWRRLFARRYNQAALLAVALGRETGCAVCPDLLVRSRPTPMLDGLGRDARHAALSGCLRPHPRHGAQAEGRPVLLVDDVMTSGATLAAAAEAVLAAGGARVDVAVLARVAKVT